MQELPNQKIEVIFNWEASGQGIHSSQFESIYLEGTQNYLLLPPHLFAYGANGS